MALGACDSVTWHAHVKVLKFEPDTVARLTAQLGHEPDGTELEYLMANAGLQPDSVAEVDGNQLTTVGLDRLTKLFIGTAATSFSNTRAVVGVGDGTTAVTVSDTDLSAVAGSTHRWFQGADATYPSQANGVITCNATFQSADGDFVWNEWCFAIATATVVPSAVFNTATTTGILVNRKVQSLGTKVSGAVWTLVGTITIT